MTYRILFVTDELEIGGTQRQMLELIRTLGKNRYRITVIYFRQAAHYVAEMEKAGAEVVHIKKRGKFDPVFFYRLCRAVRQGDYDLIHAFAFSAELWSWMANSIVGKAKFVSSIRGVYSWYSPLQWQLKQLISNFSAGIVANSHAGAEYAARQMGIRKTSFDVVYNSIDEPEASVEGAHHVYPSGKTRKIVYLGRLVREKNVGMLLEAMVVVRCQWYSAALEIVGDGPERDALERRAKALNLDDCVRFLGSVVNPEPILRSAYVVSCPSRQEGLSNSIMEAMNVGVPVVATNVGGNPELIRHGINGVLVPDNDPVAMANGLLRLINNPNERHRLGNSARSTMIWFRNKQRMVDEIEAVYERCLESPTAYAVQR